MQKVQQRLSQRVYFRAYVQLISCSFFFVTFDKKIVVGSTNDAANGQRTRKIKCSNAIVSARAYTSFVYIRGDR